MTRLVCSVVAGLAIAYAVHEVRRLVAGRRAFLVGRAQTVRRIFGSMIVAVMMVLVYAGLELIDPFARVSVFLSVWAAVSGLVILLLVLGLLDWREVSANHELERTREHFARGGGDADGGDQS